MLLSDALLLLLLQLLLLIEELTLQLLRVTAVFVVLESSNNLSCSHSTAFLGIISPVKRSLEQKISNGVEATTQKPLQKFNTEYEANLCIE